MQTSADMHLIQSVNGHFSLVAGDRYGKVARGKEAKGFASFVYTPVQKKIGTTKAVAT